MKKLMLVGAAVLMAAASGTAHAGSYGPTLPPGGGQLVPFAEAKTHSKAVAIGQQGSSGWANDADPKSATSTGIRYWEWHRDNPNDAPANAQFSATTTTSGPDMQASVSGYGSAYAWAKFSVRLMTANPSDDPFPRDEQLPTVYSGQVTQSITTTTSFHGTFPTQPGDNVVTAKVEAKVETYAGAQGGVYMATTSTATTGGTQGDDSNALESIDCNGSTQY